MFTHINKTCFKIVKTVEKECGISLRVKDKFILFVFLTPPVLPGGSKVWFMSAMLTLYDSGV